MNLANLKEQAHHFLAVGSAVALGVSGAATLVAQVIDEFGGHVTTVQITGLTALVSGLFLLGSKLIDSANNAITGVAAVAVTPAAVTSPLNVANS